MKKWKIPTILIVSVALFLTNIYLITKVNSPVSRSIFVKDWTKVKNDTVTKTYQTKGVITSAEEYQVYYDGDNKEFKRFLVKEGDEVTAGTPLFEYDVKNINQQISSLKSEIAKLEGEMAGVDEYITKLKDYQPTSTPSKNTHNLVANDPTQEIYKQELEKTKLEEEKKRLDSDLAALTKQSGPLTVDSETDGIVKKIDETLKNPIITIASSKQAVKGLLTESQLRKTKVGMAVQIKSPHLAGDKNGMISQVDTYPSKEPSLDKAPLFPFQVSLEPKKSQMKEPPFVIGSKVKVTVTTNEAVGVLTVPAQIVHGKNQPYLFKVAKNGYLNKEYIRAGLKTDKKIEIVKGLAKGEVVLTSPEMISKNHSTFITPIRIGQLTLTGYHKLTNREKIRYFLIGFLEK